MAVLSASSWSQGSLKVCLQESCERVWAWVRNHSSSSCPELCPECAEAELLGRRCLPSPGSGSSCDCLDLAMLVDVLTLKNTHQCNKKNFQAVLRVWFAVSWSGLAFTDIVQLEMLWINARDRIKMELWPWLGGSRTLYEQNTSNVVPQSKDDFHVSWDKVMKGEKHLPAGWNSSARETSRGERQTRGDISKCWCQKAPGWVVSSLSLVIFLLLLLLYQYRNTSSSSDIFHLHFSRC